MTKEEAIEILQGAIKKPNTKDGYLGQATDMAIKALSAEPCDDVISRQAVITRIKELCNPYGKPQIDFEVGKKLIEWFKAMPSVQPVRPKGEWISYHMGCKWICSCCNYYGNTREYKYCPNCGSKMEGAKE